MSDQSSAPRDVRTGAGGNPEQADAGEDARRTRATPLRLLDDLDAIVWELDPATRRLTYVSAAAERILGYPMSQMLAEPGFWRAHVAPEDRDRVIAAFEESIARGTDRDIEYRMIAADGSRVWLRDILHVVPNPDGSVAELHGVLVNVTRQKQLEAELRASEERFARFAEASVDGLILHEDGTVVDVNTTAAAMFGYAPAEMVGMRATDFAAPADRARLASHIAAEAESPLEGTALRKDGTTFPVEVRGRGVTLGARPARLVIVRDLTDARRAEEALRESERRLRLIMQQVPAILWTTDRELRLTSLLGAGLQRMGVVHPDSLVGVDLRSYTTAGAPADAAGLTDAHARALLGEPAAYQIEWQGVQFDAHVEPLRGPGGAIEGAIGVGLDVSERVRAERALREMEAQFRQSQKLEAVGRLAGGIAHDFNNLLTVITAFTEMVLGQLSPADPRHADLDEVVRATQQAAELTRQLLAFGRKQVMRPEHLDLTVVIREVEKMLRRVIGEDVRLETRLGQPAPIHADRSQLEQVLMNLVVNARDAMPEGGTVTIAIEQVRVDAETARRQFGSGADAGDYVRMDVVDTGVGMDESVAARVFEPFFTTKPPGAGTGLGLATVYGIVTQSGGHITVRSRPGAGTTFSVYFPAAVAPAAEPMAAPAPRVRGGSETILLAEDEESVRLVTQRILQAHGYRVFTARDGLEAIELANRIPDAALLLTDVVMPRMSGHEAAARIRAARPDIRILFMSGYPGDPILRRTVEELGPDLIQKPFSIEALTRRVRAVLDEPPRQ